MSNFLSPKETAEAFDGFSVGKATNASKSFILGIFAVCLLLLVVLPSNYFP